MHDTGNFPSTLGTGKFCLPPPHLFSVVLVRGKLLLGREHLLYSLRNRRANGSGQTKQTNQLLSMGAVLFDDRCRVLPCSLPLLETNGWTFRQAITDHPGTYFTKLLSCWERRIEELRRAPIGWNSKLTNRRAPQFRNSQQLNSLLKQAPADTESTNFRYQNSWSGRRGFRSQELGPAGQTTNAPNSHRAHRECTAFSSAHYQTSSDTPQLLASSEPALHCRLRNVLLPGDEGSLPDQHRHTVLHDESVSLHQRRQLLWLRCCSSTA